MKLFSVFSLLFFIAVFSLKATSLKFADSSWCNRPQRPGLEKFREVKTSHPWFRVFDLGRGVYAIDEPYNWEETMDI